MSGNLVIYMICSSKVHAIHTVLRDQLPFFTCLITLKGNQWFQTLLGNENEGDMIMH